MIAADGAATDFMFDDQQRPIGVRFANGDTIGLTLDEFGRQVALEVTGARWVTERDNAGRIIRRVDPTGRETMQTYGELVQWSEITDAAAETSRLEMDLARRVTSLRTDHGEVEATYAATGLVRSETASDGRTREYAYTSGGRLAKVVEESGTVECRYDEAGQLVATNTGTGWWTFDRDLYGRITRRVSPAGREQRYEYDVLGNVKAIVVDGAVWRFDYDPMGRVVKATDPTDRAKTFVYDAMGRMVESRDGRTVPLRYEYDLRGRIAAMIDSDGGTVHYDHDPTGQLTSHIDQLGRRTVVRYDAAGRHVGTDYFDRDGVADDVGPARRRRRALTTRPSTSARTPLPRYGLGRRFRHSVDAAQRGARRAATRRRWDGHRPDVARILALVRARRLRTDHRRRRHGRRRHVDDDAAS